METKPFSVKFKRKIMGHFLGGAFFSPHLAVNKALCIAHPHHLSLSPSPPVFEEPEDPSAHSFFSEIISSVSDVKFSHSGRYLLTRDYLTAKVWDLNMERKPLETYQVCEPSRGTRSVCSRARPQPLIGSGERVFAYSNSTGQKVTHSDDALSHLC